jgi:hypothetical protein
VELESQAANEATYGVETRPGTTEIVQRAITRYAVDNDLALVSAAPVRADLEDVFLRLIDSKEHAA